MPNPCIRASRFSNEFPSEADEVAERAARQRNLESELKDQIERQRRADRSDTREDERAALVPGQRAEHIEGRGEIHSDCRNHADKKNGRDKEHSQPLELARPQYNVAGLKPSPREVVYTAAQNDDADDKRKGAGIDAGGGPADAVVQAGDDNGRAERTG